MDFVLMIKKISDDALLIPSILILLGSIILSFKTRFIQFRTLPQMIRGMLWFLFPTKNQVEDPQTIKAHKAVFTAMSTTIGLASMVSPVIAIRLGGPGALLGFLLTTLFGTAANYTEVTFALSYRKRLKDGTIMGGPMQYLQDEFHRFWAKWYACFTIIVLVVWSSAQANQIADILSSNLLGPYKVSEHITGIALAVLVFVTLIGGIKRIGNLSEKLVPTMFFLYTSAALWIILCNLEQLPFIIRLIFRTAFSRQALTGAVIGGGLQQALRWGLLKGFTANEAGIGTATIPHSMAATKDPSHQGILSMTSSYSAGLISILSGLVVLLTGTWEDPALRIGINVMAQSFALYFSNIGLFILVISAFLFAFGTILGNSYNGSQCFTYLTQNRYLYPYYALIALVIFLGSIAEVTLLWTIVDFFVIPVALPNIIAIVILAFKKPNLLKITTK